MRPVRPSYRISFPFDRNPFSSRAFRIASSRSPLNGVPSMNRPSREPTLPPICSRTWATVIRDGIAWGLMIRSGMMPCAVKGMSSWGAMSPMTPFCPWREANLSPSSGMRRSRTLTFASFEPFSLSVNMTESTHPLSPWRTVTEVSRRFCGVRKSVSSSRNRGALVERDVLHGIRLDERLFRIMEEVAPRVRPQAIVARAEAQGLLRHPRAHRDARGRVVLRVRDHAGGDAEDDLRVDLDVGVFLRNRGLHRERLVPVRALELRVFVPTPHVHPGDVVPTQRVFALLAAAGDIVRIQRDEGVFFLFGIDPLDDAVPDQVGKPEAAHLQLLDVFSREHDVAVLDDQERTTDPAFVAVDDDLAHVLIVPDIHFVAQEPRSPSFPDLGDEHLRVLVEADQVAVHVDAGDLGLLALHLFRPEVREQQLDLFLRDALGDVDHQGEILDETAILAFRRLVRTKPTPLGRMEVAGLEVGLRSGQWRRHASEVAECAHVRGAVEQLAHAGAAADPVPRREGMEQALRE